VHIRRWSRVFLVLLALAPCAARAQSWSEPTDQDYSRRYVGEGFLLATVGALTIGAFVHVERQLCPEGCGVGIFFLQTATASAAGSLVAFGLHRLSGGQGKVTSAVLGYAAGALLWPLIFGVFGGAVRDLMVSAVLQASTGSWLVYAIPGVLAGAIFGTAALELDSEEAQHRQMVIAPWIGPDSAGVRLAATF
jgi:hypothetical protein